MFEVFRDLQLFRRDKYEFHVFIARHRTYQRVYRTSELEVSAQPYCHVAESALFPADRQEVGECLRRMVVTAVSCVYHRNCRFSRSDHRCAFLRVPHRDDIGICAYCPYRVSHAFALCCRRALSFREPQHVSAQLVHSSLKAESRSGRRLEKQRCQLLAMAFFSVLFGVSDYVLRHVYHLIDFFCTELHDVDQMFHLYLLLITF